MTVIDKAAQTSVWGSCTELATAVYIEIATTDAEISDIALFLVEKICPVIVGSMLGFLQLLAEHR